MGPEEGDPPLTGLTLVQVVEENHFCLRTRSPYNTEILIQVNFKGVALAGTSIMAQCSWWVSGTQRRKNEEQLDFKFGSLVRSKPEIEPTDNYLLAPLSALFSRVKVQREVKLKQNKKKKKITLLL